MIHFYTDPKYCPKDKAIMHKPERDYFIDYAVSGNLDESDSKLVEKIEGTKLLPSGDIQSKFTKATVPISISCLSSGCKVALCINNAVKNNRSDKVVFDILACGGNAIKMILEYFKDKEIFILCQHKEFGYTNDTVVEVNSNEIVHSTAEIERVIREWENS